MSFWLRTHSHKPSYDQLIAPERSSIYGSTLRKLEKERNATAKIVSVRRYPTACVVEGRYHRWLERQPISESMERIPH